MKAITILAFAIALGGYAQAQQKRDGEVSPPPKEVKIEARFTAKVRWIEMIGNRDAKVVPVAFDPRFLAGIEILSIESPVKPFDKKGKITLAIHSPAILFAGDEKAAGKTYAFKVFGTMRDGRPEFYAAHWAPSQDGPFRVYSTGGPAPKNG